MSEVIKKYSNDEVTVVWQPAKCIHSTKCVTQLGSVFDPKAKPWINMQGSDSESIAIAVRGCPSGALTLEGESPEQPSAESPSAQIPNAASTTIKVVENGPLLVSGVVTITDNDGNASEVSNPALCRCGASNNKPFCDGSHNTAEFKS